MAMEQIMKKNLKILTWSIEIKKLSLAKTKMTLMRKKRKLFLVKTSKLLRRLRLKRLKEETFWETRQKEDKSRGLDSKMKSGKIPLTLSQWG